MRWCKIRRRRGNDSEISPPKTTLRAWLAATRQCGRSSPARFVTWKPKWSGTRLRDGHSPALDLLFIEDVGNLVCPASYDLGEDLRVVLMSATEGEDKPLKYPPIFHGADLAVITKVDLAEAVEFDSEAAVRHVQAVRPGLPLIYVSAKKGDGMLEWLQILVSLVGPAECSVVDAAGSALSSQRERRGGPQPG
jgi:Ni2+-binding GTPase involved in maturation of urease and hydrogenase